MCSLLFSTKNIENLEYKNRFMKLRGPDSTVYAVDEEFYAIHNLLSITGEFTEQPLISDGGNIIVLFNGEIYNFKDFGDYDNDTKCIIPLYKKYGEDFISKLDGEFAIVLFDKFSKTVIATSDVFGTKPLWYSIEGNDIGISTYKSGLEGTFKDIKKFKANTTIIFNKKNGEYKTNTVYDFDLSQHKDNFNDWNEAFAKSIVKRSCQNIKEKIFIGLSSGYDSGTIVSEMIRQGAGFTAYSATGSENFDVLNARYNILKDYSKANLKVTTITPELRSKAHNYIVANTEDWKYTIHSQRSSYNEYNLSLVDDNGSNGLSHICSMAKNDGMKIFLSGAGADEIFSDYGWNGVSKYNHSNFGGKFPEDLKTIFPWASFFGSSMESYLMKDEFVAGSYGIEGRYPFIDKMVVQEFLWLKVNLKNERYKYVLDNHLRTNNFPFCPGQKIGF